MIAHGNNTEAARKGGLSAVPILVACRMTARETCGVIVRGLRARAVVVAHGVTLGARVTLARGLR